MTEIFNKQTNKEKKENTVLQYSVILIKNIQLKGIIINFLDFL